MNECNPYCDISLFLFPVAVLPIALFALERALSKLPQNPLNTFGLSCLNYFVMARYLPRLKMRLG